MPADLRGKVALITGVGRVGQIGHAVARGVGRAGAKLLLADVNAVGLADRVKEFAAEGIAAVRSDAFLRKGASSALITLGEADALLHSKSQSTLIPSFKVGPVVGRRVLAVAGIW